MGSEQNELLSQLLLKWEEAWDLGDDIPAADLCADCPELTEALEGQIKLLKSMSWMKQDAAEDSIDQDEEDVLIGTTLADRYKIEALVGFGGHGKVYRAFDPELQRHVAVKISKKVAVDNASDELLEEARRAAKLKHPGIVAVHDVGRHDGQLFFVTELVEGTNLADVIESGPTTVNDSKRIISSLAEALNFAHEHGFLHRDIKPANVLIDQHGRVLITDFGIATTIDKIEDHRGGTPGTLPYMAPEQVAGEVQLIDARTDIHALGVVFFELLTGQLPYQGRTPTAVREQILLRQPKPPSAYNKSISKQLEDVVLKCLAKHPADRFSSSLDIIDELSNPQVNHRRRLLWFAGTMFAMLIGSAIWQLQPDTRSSTVPNLEPQKEENVLEFDGTNRIVTPLKRFYPVTLEAWVYPQSRDIHCHFIIGSDIQGEYGIGLALCGSLVSVEQFKQMLKSRASAPPDQWSHVAAVFSTEETRLYLNGKLVLTGPATERVSDETTFVVGNVGMNSPIAYFEGKIRSLRISDGERYTSNFTPKVSLTELHGEDTSARLIFDGAHHDGETVTDLSGNGNDGRWE